MEPSRKLLGTGAELVFVKDKPGRITFEYSQDKKRVILQVIAGIAKAQETLGIKGAEKMEETAETAVKKIMHEYPSALVADVLTALEMASFGQIKLPDQLNVVSPANIFNWYKVFRSDFGHLSANPMVLTPKQMPEPDDKEKADLIREFFQKGISDPDSIIGGFDSVFTRIIKLGFYSVNAENMEQRFRTELNRVAFSFKIQSVSDQAKKGKLIQLQNQINTAYKDCQIDFKTLKSDEQFKEAFILVSDQVKKEIVKEIMKTNSVETVMNIYSKQK